MFICIVKIHLVNNIGQVNFRLQLKTTVGEHLHTNHSLKVILKRSNSIQPQVMGLISKFGRIHHLHIWQFLLIQNGILLKHVNLRIVSGHTFKLLSLEHVGQHLQRTQPLKVLILLRKRGHLKSILQLLLKIDNAIDAIGKTPVAQLTIDGIITDGFQYRLRLVQTVLSF